MKLFCFSYAGGSSFFYHKWKLFFNLSNALELIPLEYRGHGLRMEEGFYNNFNEMIDDMLTILLTNLKTNEPFMLFGHSMGSYIAFIIANILEKKNIFAKHIFFSGCLPPCFWTARKKRISTLPDNKFIEEILKYGGIERESLNYPEIYDYIIKLLRNDFKVIESLDTDYLFIPLKSNISILNGDSDKLVPSTKIQIWKKYSSGECTIKFYHGGHFYINDNLNEIFDYILKKCKSEDKTS